MIVESRTTMATSESVHRLSGLGINCTPREVVLQCQRKIEGKPQAWTVVDYLSMGVSSKDVLPPDMVPMLRAAGLQVAVHFLELNVVRPLQAQREAIDELARLVEVVEPVAIEQDMGLWTWRGAQLGLIPPIFDDDTARVIGRNAADLQTRFGLPYYAENPPIDFVVGDLDLLAFMQRVAEYGNCGLVLDIGHLVGYCAITDREPSEYLHAWPGIRHVRELHIAGFTLKPDAPFPIWYDDHAEAIGDYSLDLAALAHERAGRKIPVTLEQEGASMARVVDHVTRAARRFFA
jgi:uncharacterized protein (UPF0276 family)